MNKILFITSRNAYSTCGELRLIKNRTIVLKKEYNLNTDFVLIRSKKTFLNSQENIPNTSYKIFRHGLLSYFHAIKDAEKYIRHKLETENYSGVIISGVTVLPLVCYIRRFSGNTKIIADLHGAFEELIEFSSSSLIKNIIRRTYYRLAKHLENKYLKFFDGYLAVSVALKEYIQKEYSISNKPFFIVPCALSANIPALENLKNIHNKSRQKYNIKDDECLFIYSGGTSPWQCIEQSVNLFHIIKNSYKNLNAKMLILSGNIHAIKKFQCESVMVDSLSADKVQDVICGANFAFMLRDDFVTNNVAFPNKFLEYVAAGVEIIATPFVYDVYNYINKYNIGMCITDLERIPDNSFFKSLNFPTNYTGRVTLLHETNFKTTLQKLNDFLNK